MNPDYAEHRRDCRLRRRLLQALHAVRVRPESGWMTGRFAFDLVDGARPGGERFASDIHGLSLLRELVQCGYVEERDDRRPREPFTLEATRFHITAAGSAVVLELVEADPLIEDSRAGSPRIPTREIPRSSKPVERRGHTETTRYEC